jgi:rhodanese-related sulfurtransferase
MEFFVQNWPLVLLALVSGGMLLAPMLHGRVGGSSVGAAEAVRLINRERGILIDVGEPAEYAQGHPAGARNVPLSGIDGHKDLPTNKGLPLIVCCPTGARSSRAAALLRKAGYEKAVTLAGGLRTWRDANLPVEKAGDDKPKAAPDKGKGNRK